MNWSILLPVVLVLAVFLCLARFLRAPWMTQALLVFLAVAVYLVWNTVDTPWQKLGIALLGLVFGLGTVYFGREDLKVSFKATLFKGFLRKAMRGQFEALITGETKFVEKPWHAPEGILYQVVSLPEAKLEWIKPKSGQSKKVLYYLHGGAYVAGIYNLYRDYACRLSAAFGGCSVALLDYRLAPEYGFPKQLEDALAGYELLLDQGYKPEDIVVGGDSAGGNLCLVLPLKLRELEMPMPHAVFALSPLADMSGYSPSIHSNMPSDIILGPGLAKLAGKAVRMIPPNFIAEDRSEEALVSPVFADFKGFPPLLLQVGEDEVLRYESEAVYHQARRAGVNVHLEVYRGMFHVFHIHRLPEATQAIERIARFVEDPSYYGEPTSQLL